MIKYGVEGILSEYKKAGFNTMHFPINDQGVSSFSETKELINWMDSELEKEANILVHCVGGLGRTGLIAACYLVSQGITAQNAIQEIRKVRSKRAIESESQENFIYAFENRLAL